jgi:hypothetical protein
MLGPSWLIDSFVAIVLATAAYCVGRIAVGHAFARRTDYPVDAVHIAMGVAMAGMFRPSLRILSTPIWEAIFAVAAVGFAGLTVRDGVRAGGGRHVWHAFGSAAMVYMLAAMPGDMASMPGMTSGMSLRYPLVAVAVGLLLLAYAWTTSLQLLGLTSTSAGPQPAACGSALAPRLAACCELAMGITMAYPLIALA